MSNHIGSRLKPYRLPLILLVLALAYIGLLGDKGRIFISPLTDKSTPTFRLVKVAIISPRHGARYQQRDKIRFAAMVAGNPSMLKWISNIDGEFENKSLDFVKRDLSPGKHDIIFKATIDGRIHRTYVRLIIQK